MEKMGGQEKCKEMKHNMINTMKNGTEEEK